MRNSTAGFRSVNNTMKSWMKINSSAIEMVLSRLIARARRGGYKAAGRLPGRKADE
jgi:hypothetical protein